MWKPASQGLRCQQCSAPGISIISSMGVCATGRSHVIPTLSSCLWKYLLVYHLCRSSRGQETGQTWVLPGFELTQLWDLRQHTSPICKLRNVEESTRPCLIQTSSACLPTLHPTSKGSWNLRRPGSSLGLDYRQEILPSLRLRASIVQYRDRYRGSVSVGARKGAQKRGSDITAGGSAQWMEPRLLLSSDCPHAWITE